MKDVIKDLVGWLVFGGAILFAVGMCLVMVPILVVMWIIEWMQKEFA